MSFSNNDRAIQCSLDGFADGLATNEKLSEKNLLDGEVDLKSADPGLKACLAHPMLIRSKHYTMKGALQLLNAHIPFICAGPWTWFGTGHSGSHAIVVTGYFQDNGLDPSTYPNHIAYEIRDSANLRASTATLGGDGAGCSSVYKGTEGGIIFLLDPAEIPGLKGKVNDDLLSE